MKLPKLTSKRVGILSAGPVLGILFLMGPRVPVDTGIQLRSDLPDDLQALKVLIDQEEEAIGNVKEIARKQFTFFPRGTNAPVKTRYAVVAVHGFSSSREDTAPWAGKIAEALGANLFETRVTGHGLEDSDQLLEATVNAWLNDAAEAIEIGKKLSTDGVVVLGASTGASALSWILCQERDEFRDGVVAGAFISPNYGVNHPDAPKLLWPWAEVLLKASGGDRRTSDPGKAVPESYFEVWYPEYPAYGIAPTVALAELAQEAPRLQVPVWIGYSKRDVVVKAEVSEAFVEKQRKLGASIETRDFGDTGDPGDHMIIGEILAPGTTQVAVDSVLQFLSNHGIEMRKREGDADL